MWRKIILTKMKNINIFGFDSSEHLDIRESDISTTGVTVRSEDRFFYISKKFLFSYGQLYKPQILFKNDKNSC